MCQNRHAPFNASCNKPEQEGITLKYVEDFCLNNGSSQGRNLAMTVVYVPRLREGGSRKAPLCQLKGLVTCCLYLAVAHPLQSLLQQTYHPTRPSHNSTPSVTGVPRS